MNWFEKLKLLVWKNFLLQKRHKYQTLFEILAPVIFSSFLLLVRSLVVPTTESPYSYTPFSPLILQNKTALSNFTSTPTQNGTIAFCPDTPLTRKITRDALTMIATANFDIIGILSIFTADVIPQPLGFKNAKEMEKYLTKPNAMKQIIAGLEYDESMKDSNTWPDNITIILRFPAIMRFVWSEDNPVDVSWRTNLLYPYYTKNQPRLAGYNNGGCCPGYANEFFLALQHSVSRQITQDKTGVELKHEVLLQRFPHLGYRSDKLNLALEKFVSMIIMMCFAYTFVNTVRMVTMEKELQLKETMTIMGVPPWLHWLAWFIKQFTFLFISVTLMVILFKIPLVSTEDGYKVAVFTQTSWSILLFFMVLFVIASISFSFLVSVFFCNANTAASFMGLAWFTTYAVYMLTKVIHENISLTTKVLLNLISNTAMGFAFQMLVVLEGTNGLHWKNLFKPVTPYDKFVPGHVALILLLDSILYVLLAMYIERIRPGNFGVPLPWNFPFTKSFWRPNKNQVTDDSISADTDSEYNDALLKIVHDEEPKGAKVGVNIKNLTKIFKGKKKAVDSLNLRVYENEITVLLGHNGAGKTTTISMLTGLIPPTSGVAEINGYNIVTKTSDARKSLGICPQHNVLFPNLTVAEHIRFYSRLKGVPKIDIQKEIDHFLRLLDLEEKRDVVSCKLSGGQMRRLSVGAAMCGNSTVVLLDEPTSGLDPAARRALWDLLQKEKNGRSIILTTHFMDEADILGDRIAIMSGGKLQCIGTPYFLKKHYGVGYNLTIVKDDRCDAARVTSFFSGYIPDIKENTNIGSELSYILPNEYVSVFPEMLENFESEKESLHVISYGLTVTNLEEVFMKVGAEDDEELQMNGNGTAVQYNNMDNEVTLPLGNTEEQDPTEPLEKERGSKLLKNHIKAMFLKLFYHNIRNKLTASIQLVMPIINITISIIISRSWKFLEDLPPLKMSLESGFGKTETLISEEGLSDNQSILGKAYEAYINYFKTSMYPGMEALVIGNNNISKVYLKMQKEETERMQTEDIVGATFEKNKIIAWFSNYGFHDPAISLALADNAVLDSLSPGSRINVINHPLPYSFENLLKVISTARSMGFQFAFNMGFCLAFICAFLVIFPIKERTSGAKLLQRISGVRPLVFWGCAYLWDMLWHALIYLGIIITLACYNEQTLSSPAELGRVMLVLLIFSMAMIPIHYVSSFLFQSAPATGFAKMCFFNIFIGCMPFLITEVLRLPGTGSPYYADIFDWVFSPLPLYCASRSLRDMSQTSFAIVACEAFCNEIPKSFKCTPEKICKQFNFSFCCIGENPFFSWAEPGIGRYLFMMFLAAVVAITVLLVKEYELINKLFYKTSPLPPAPNKRFEDDDVLAEQNNVRALTQNELQQRSLVVKDLTKYYKQFLAVKRLNFAVTRGECFGLLGVNGAGKTTTFKMLTGDSRISCGDAFVHGYSIKTNLQEVYRYIGYCPQFDGLLDNLTARETLRIFCLLRGIPSQVGAARANHLASILGFTRHFDKRVIECSGGTKRKISTALALLGDSPLIFLDEPTTGMDPASKRLVWSSLMLSARSGRSIVLTSHSMEECEALCSRLTIMVQGQLNCIGPTQHLKNKFSQGYSLIVKCKSGPELATTLEQVNQYVTTTFGAKRVDTYLGISTFFIKDTSILWWQLFAAMEEARKEYNIEDYSISQTTLEQVFLSFTNRQTNEPDGPIVIKT